MTTSQAGIDLIKSFEGCVLKAYRCPAGVWTIGYGHTAGVKEGQRITQTQAEQLLKDDLLKYEAYVEMCGLSLNQHQFDALVSFAYNCGQGNLKKLVKGRTLPQIGEALLLYNKAAGKQLTGLTRRRMAERELFFGGNTGSQEPAATLRRGSKGTDVKWLQEKLNKRGYTLKADGIFGNATDEAVRAFQAENNLTVDGIVGNKTKVALRG